MRASDLLRAFANVFLFALPVFGLNAQDRYHIKAAHPRVIIEDIAAVAQRCAGPLADDYRVVKERADAAVRRGGIEFISNQWCSESSTCSGR